MSLFPSDPAYLERVRELHATVRDWIERSATAQKNEHLRANLPYVDLMFAFGFATLGDHPTANKLVEDARKVQVVPIPEGGSPQAEQAVTAAVVRNFMFKAFRYRVEQAMVGKPPSGSLSAAVLAEREEIGRVGGPGPVNNPHKLAEYVIDRFREQSRIVEPYERVDYYASRTNHADVMKRELAEVSAIREPGALAERIRKLYQDGLPGKWTKEVQFYLLHEGLPLAGRVSEAFTVELLEHVPAALLNGVGGAIEPPDMSRKQGELLERALFLAGHFKREDIVKRLVDSFIAFVHSKPEEMRLKLINVVARQCIRNLKKLGMRSEIDQFLTQLQSEVPGGLSLTELRKKHAWKPDAWSAVLQTLLNLAGGWMFVGLNDRAESILGAARNELLDESASKFQPKEYTELARAYVIALGDAPSEQGLAAMIELFKRMSPTKITNTWTTAQYYSRFHLNLVEDIVLALCPCGPDEPVPAIVQA